MGEQPDAQRGVIRFGALLVIAVAWVVAASLLPSRPQERVVGAAALGPGVTDVAGPGVDGSGGPEGATDVTAGGAGGGPTGGDAGGGPAGGRGGGVQAPVVGAGVSKAGVRCGPGVRALPLSAYAAPCVAAFDGPNGGDTYRGVTAGTIKIVNRTFPETADSRAVGAVAQQAGAADPAVARAVAAEMITWLQKHYELYGRKVEIVTYESRFGDAAQEIQGRGREGACLDAEVVANEIKAFGVLSSTSKLFTECAAQRKLVVFDGAPYASETFYRRYHPYVWAIVMDCERIIYQLAEYLSKRIVRRKARWAGDPAFRQQDRRIGSYTPISNDDDKTCADLVTRESARLGLEPHFPSTYRYALDVSRLPDEAARGIIQFKRDGVTTVLLACDPISAIFLTQQATSQRYHPEWLIMGVALTDVDNAARLWDQQQVHGRLFGMSQLGPTPKILGPGSEPGRVYQQATGKTIPGGTDGGYFGLVHMFNLLQAAGPVLTPDAVGRGAWTLPPGGAPDYATGYWSFLDGPDGAPGGRDHTAIDDSREVYWMNNVLSPADGKRGAYVETYGGRRFRNGGWPAEEPPVYPGM